MLKLFKSTKKVDQVSARQKFDFGINSNDYLTTDYTFQAKKEQERGNDLEAAKIYTESLRISPKQPEIQQVRQAIIQKINTKSFETCPFEIGLLYNNGYQTAIPAFASLPITVKKIAATPNSVATSLNIIIQKYDYFYRNIGEFKLDYLKPCPTNTDKIEYTMTLHKSGVLTIFGRELNGYGRTKADSFDLKKFI